MAAIYDGGSAFPTIPLNHGYDGSEGTGSGPGITVRDFFAAAAMIGLHCVPEYGGKDCEDIARISYKQADEMLAARSKA